MILERRDTQKPSTQAERIPTSRRFRTEEAHLSVKEEISHGSAVVKIMDTFEEFRIDAALRVRKETYLCGIYLYRILTSYNLLGSC